MKLDENGVNEFGVAMCCCRRFGRPHAWEPGETCSTERVNPVVQYIPARDFSGVPPSKDKSSEQHKGPRGQ